MQETQNMELFSDLSSEESATINGGYYYDCYGYSRPVSYHYRSYHYSTRSVGYAYGSYYDCY